MATNERLRCFERAVIRLGRNNEPRPCADNNGRLTSIVSQYIEARTSIPVSRLSHWHVFRHSVACGQSRAKPEKAFSDVQCMQDSHCSYSVAEANHMPCRSLGPAQSEPPMPGTNDQVFLLSPPYLSPPPPSSVGLVQSIRDTIFGASARGNEGGEETQK